MKPQTLRQISLLLAVGLILAGVYLVVVFAGRASRGTKHEETLQQKEKQKYSPYAKEDLEKLRILHFYASPATITAGQQALLCYGVQGAASVRVSNLEIALKPTRNRCVSIQPQTSTTFTLSASGEQGSVTASLRLVVDAAN